MDEIPPIPMPSKATGGHSGPDGPRTVTTYDAETGESREYPLSPAVSGSSGQKSDEPAYTGPFPVSPEPMAAAFGAMVPANDLANFPRSPNVKLIMRFGTNWYTASGSMNDAGVVLTAAHCVYEYGGSGWADEIWVYPGWDGVGDVWGPDINVVFENFGWARGTWFMAGSDYINNGNWDRDCGLISLSDRNVGMLTGWFGWIWGYDCSYAQSHNYYNFSYPAQGCPTPGLHTGRTMYYWDGTIDACPGNQLELSTGNQCFTAVWGGMSGSGLYWVDNGYRRVHAVCSTSDRASWGDYCKLWEQFVIDMETFESNTRGSTFDLEALMVRSTGATTVEAGSSLPNFTAYVCNATNADPGNATYTLRVYLSANTNISESDTLLGTYYYTVDYAAMDGWTWGIPFPTIPANTPAGDYWIGVVLDSSTDGNYGNNDSDTWDAEAIHVECTAPSSPTNVAASDGTSDSYVHITWDAVAAATGYQVYRDGSPIGSLTANTYYDDTSAYPGPVYYYAVTAEKLCGNPSALSASNGGWRRVAPPANVSATDGTYAGYVHVTWNGSTGASHYQVSRSATADGTKAAVSGWISATYYDDAAGEPFQHCYYWVRAAENGLGDYPSSYSLSDIGWRDPSSPAAFRVDAAGRIFADGNVFGQSFNAGSADVAEWVTVSEPVEPGDVLELDPWNPGHYRKAVGPCSSLVAGVASTEPGFALGSRTHSLLPTTNAQALLALVGMVAVKACDENGPIALGDLVVPSSRPGYVMRWDNERFPSCMPVGKALQELGSGTGAILVLLMR